MAGHGRPQDPFLPEHDPGGGADPALIAGLQTSGRVGAGVIRVTSETGDEIWGDRMRMRGQKNKIQEGTHLGSEKSLKLLNCSTSSTSLVYFQLSGELSVISVMSWSVRYGSTGQGRARVVSSQWSVEKNVVVDQSEEHHRVL